MSLKKECLQKVEKTVETSILFDKKERIDNAKEKRPSTNNSTGNLSI